MPCSLTWLGLQEEMGQLGDGPSFYNRNSNTFSNEAGKAHVRQAAGFRLYFNKKGLSLPQEQTTLCKTAI